MTQLPSQSVTWVTLSWIHSSLYPRTFSFSTSGATPSHSKIRPGSLWITWIFCGVLLGAESREQNTITLCRKIKHYLYWKWLKRQFHPLSLYQPEEKNFCKPPALCLLQVQKIRSVSVSLRDPKNLREPTGHMLSMQKLMAGSACVSHIIAVNHIWLHIIILS